MHCMNSVASETKVKKMYSELMEAYENLLVEMKYDQKFTNTEIKKEMDRLNKFYLDEFFKRAK